MKRWFIKILALALFVLSHTQWPLLAETHAKGVEGGGGGPSFRAKHVPLDVVSAFVLKDNRTLYPQDIQELRLDSENKCRECALNIDYIVLANGDRIGSQDIRSIVLRSQEGLFAEEQNESEEEQEVEQIEVEQLSPTRIRYILY